MVRLYLKLTSNNKMNTPTEDLTTLSQSLLFYYSIRVNTTEVVDDIDTRIFKKINSRLAREHLGFTKDFQIQLTYPNINSRNLVLILRFQNIRKQKHWLVQ
ncbi:hypothetical protein YC2023_112109 [Brassica napus]